MLTFVVAALWAAMAQARPMPVSLGAQPWFEPGSRSFAGRALSVDFTAPELEPGTFSIFGDAAFTIADVPATLRIDGVVRGDTALRVGWFDYGGRYTGIDVVFGDVLEPGDQLQIVLLTRRVPFDGPVTAPTLRPMSVDGLGGFVGWFRADGDYIDGQLGAGHYNAGVVPEPASAALAVVGAAMILGVARRRRQAEPGRGDSRRRAVNGGSAEPR
jgi:hypothetical protein